MDAMAERLQKLRDERNAREKARIEKLRELNLKKYNKPDEQPRNASSNLSIMNKSSKSQTSLKSNPPKPNPGTVSAVKNSLHLNGSAKRPISAPQPVNEVKSKINTNLNTSRVEKVVPSNSIQERKVLTAPIDKKIAKGPASKLFETKNLPERKVSTNMQVTNPKKPWNVPERKPSVSNNNLSRKSYAPTEKPKMNQSRKSLAPPTKTPQSVSKTTSAANNSVFERLYKPKPVHNTHANDVEKLQNDPNYLKKVIRTTGLILNKRHTVFETKPKYDMPVRRSISAVHLKRVSKQELGNCIHKWSSIGDKLNNIHLRNVNEDDKVHEDKVVSAIKSERRKVTFLTPVSLNTPRPEELQARLKAWLQKRGKSLDSYHHLQCFGIHHLPHRLQFDTKPYDDENKENIAVASDSDDDSYTETMNDEKADVNNKWRTASLVSDSVDFNESQDTMTTCSEGIINIDEIVIGALNDLTELLREGFEWEQCARWLRAIRERFPAAPHTAAYWECRAALEEKRGDLPASVQCWEEAIVKGTEHSVVEANLDQLLDKFMQLKISPNSGKSQRPVDSKFVDLKNVFKSTIIRFAVQQGKLRQSGQCSPDAKFCVTPVRRSARLSTCGSERVRARTPLQLCETIRHAQQLAGDKIMFVPNRNLHNTP